MIVFLHGIEGKTLGFKPGDPQRVDVHTVHCLSGIHSFPSSRFPCGRSLDLWLWHFAPTVAPTFAPARAACIKTNKVLSIKPQRRKAAGASSQRKRRTVIFGTRSRTTMQSSEPRGKKKNFHGARVKEFIFTIAVRSNCGFPGFKTF